MLYLLLSGELCELRHAVDETLLSFFKIVYRQHAIRRLLKRLTQMDGGLLNDLPQRARTAYQQLLQAFGTFLATEVAWGTEPCGIPLWRLIYGNLNRLSLIARALAGNKALARAAADLEARAQALVEELLGLPANGTEPADGPVCPKAGDGGPSPGHQPRGHRVQPRAREGNQPR